MVLSNKPGRIDRIVERLSAVSERGRAYGARGPGAPGTFELLVRLLRWQSPETKPVDGSQVSWGRPTFRSSGERHVQTCHHDPSQTPPRFITCTRPTDHPCWSGPTDLGNLRRVFADLGSVVLDTRSGIAFGSRRVCTQSCAATLERGSWRSDHL